MNWHMIQPHHQLSISAAISSDVNRLSESVARRLREDSRSGGGSDPALAMRRSERLTAALLSFSRALAGESEPNPEFLAEAAREASAAAQAGVDLLELIHTYRVLQSSMWDILLNLTTELVPDASEQLDVQKWVSRLQHSWHDTAVANVIDAYRSEQHRFFYKSEGRQLRNEVREFIAGRRLLPPSASYDFEGQHLSVVTWGHNPKEAIQTAGKAFGATKQLVLESTGGTFLGWLAVIDDPRIIGQLRPEDLPDGTHLAIGSVISGFDGFRQSYQRAWRAYRVGLLTGAKLTSYADVALEAIFTTDIQAVRDLVALQLGPLLADPRRDVLCETLSAYFTSGFNAVSAAGTLQVHERTVAYRLRSIEERLGVTVSERHVELLVALRLHSLLRSVDSTAMRQESPGP